MPVKSPAAPAPRPTAGAASTSSTITGEKTNPRTSRRPKNRNPRPKIPRLLPRELHLPRELQVVALRPREQLPRELIPGRKLFSWDVYLLPAVLLVGTTRTTKTTTS